MESIREQRLKDFRELDKILKVGDLVRYKMDGPRDDQYALVISRNPDAVFPGFWMTWMFQWLGPGNGTVSLHSARYFGEGRMEVVR